MKHTLTLNEAEIAQAVADYVAKKTGRGLEVNVSLAVETKRDYFDRDTGYGVTAIATYEDLKP